MREHLRAKYEERRAREQVALKGKSGIFSPRGLRVAAPQPRDPRLNNDTNPRYLSRHLRIAVAVSGFTRTSDAEYRDSLQDLAQNIVFPNVALGHEVHVFQHAWDIDGTRRTGSWVKDPRYDELGYWTATQSSLSQDELDIDAYKRILDKLFVNLTLEVESYADVSRQWLDRIRGKTQRRYRKGKTLHSIISKLGMWYGIGRSFDLMSRKFNASDIDVVIRTRPDLRYKGRVVFRGGKCGTILVTETYHQRQYELEQPIPGCLLDGSLHGPVAMSKTTVPSEHWRRMLRTSKQHQLETHLNLWYTGGTVIVPFRGEVKEGITDDMFAVGAYGPMQRFCAAYNNLDLYIDALWEELTPLQSEDITVLNAIHHHLWFQHFPQLIKKS
ncbi:hypothetical protein CYMTET_5728 [Cymbomonas tetramitiformis]|uniref:Uncharacterized protein n=1 Tax=Cymbomonas tetramitiformis TaxID=36881 RepID=A0AAE0GYL2_9CHLO|nr:hypothetical protein CYMTET_5728 [Cymbomonas tetramitiformis]